jgi:uncharacterized protein
VGVPGEGEFQADSRHSTCGAQRQGGGIFDRFRWPEKAGKLTVGCRVLRAIVGLKLSKRMPCWAVPHKLSCDMIAELLRAIQSGRTDQVVRYLDADGDPTHVDADGLSLLQWCAYHGDTTAVLALIHAGAPATQLGDNLDINGAAFHGHVSLVNCLIEFGADVNQPLAETGETPLHAALCKSGDARFDTIVRRLVDAGANPNCATRPGVTTEAFMRDVRTRGETPLHRAAAFGSANVIQTLIAAGARLESRDVNGDSPLGWASWHLRPRSILRLLCFPPFQVRE